jgi:hypothetical protein
VFGRIPAEVLSKDKDFGGTKPLLCRRLEQHKGGEMKRRLIAVASITVLICVVLGNIVACTPPTEYALFINSTEGGSVTTPGEGMFTCDEGAVVDLVATPDAGYKFVNWTSNVGTIANVNNATTTITMNGDYSITANFAAVALYDLTIASTTGGSVTTPGEGTFTYEERTDVNLVAKADEGYVFDEWVGDVDTITDVKDANTTITINGDYSITASFIELPEQPTKLVIGTARDTDEWMAVFEKANGGIVMREFVEQVNLAGGVHLSAYDTASGDCYVPLEIDRREVDVATWDVGNVTAEICADIANGDVHFLWGGPGPGIDCMIAQAPIANEAEVVLLALEGGESYIRNDPTKLAKWPYVFNTMSYCDWYQLPVLADMLEAELGRIPKAYVVHTYDSLGEEYFAAAEDSFAVIDHVGVPYDGAELDTEEVVLDAKAALGDPHNPNYDIFCCFCYHESNLLNIHITGTIMAHNFNPPAMVIGVGAQYEFYAYLFSDPPDPSLVEGILSITSAAYDANPEIQAVYDLIAKRYDDEAAASESVMPGWPGIMLLEYWAIPCYWAGMEMWLEAVERVGYVDQEKLRDALAALKDDPADTILGDCWFRMYGTHGEGGGNLDYLCHTGEIGQWQSGIYETVGYDGITDDLPNYMVTADFMFPMTDQWKWLED